MVRIAKESDLAEVGRIYEEVLDHEARTTSYTNWKKDLYPTLETAQKAFEQGTLFVGEEEGGLYGSMILNQIQPKEYGDIDWKIPAAPDEVMVIHTLCIRPDAHGRGKGREMVRFCEEYARGNNWRVIRLDTYEGNLPASALYIKLGYSLAGITRFHFQNVIWENLKTFEKEL